ncbi:hypothetical protein MMS56_29280, partial [Escherichia coli]|nr:hypothetical protein [Escherichia coli]
PFANCAKSAGRHGKVVNGDTIFLIQHRAETAECSSVIDIEITVAEEVGIEGRWGYFDKAGQMRDMIQNHLLQILCMIAMSP